MLINIVLGSLLLLAIAGIAFFLRKNRSLNLQHQALITAHEAMRQRFRGVVDADAERQRVLSELESQRAAMEAEFSRIRASHEQGVASLQQQARTSTEELGTLREGIARLQEEFRALDEEANLQSFGFYQPRYDFASSEQYQARLETIRQQQKQMLSAKTAAVSHIEWTVNGSRVEGRKQTNQTIKLILRAFNGECDAAIAKVKYNNVNVMTSRIRKAWEAINGLVSVQKCEITRTYLELKLEELFLAHEYQEKVQAEKEEQRRIREQMREEEIAQREFEKAQQDAEREEKRYAEALRKAQEEVEKATGAKQAKLQSQIEELERRLAEAHTRKERAIARAQMTRSGHVYVISNVGSFGEQVYKIGMTRRLDPMERIRELGDASVPFQFDVHAVIFSEDAPSLENKLHRLFTQRRVNLVNERKEFFEASIDEIADAVRSNHGEIEITKLAEAEEYRKSQAIRAERANGSADKVALPGVELFAPATAPAALPVQ